MLPKPVQFHAPFSHAHAFAVNIRRNKAYAAFGVCKYRQYARARVLSIDTSEAEALPGVVCVLTQKDIPGKVNVGHLKKDQPTMIGIGEITSIPTAPAIADAYYRYDGRLRTSLPLENTPYTRK